MKSESWRDIARPIIAQVLADNKGKTEQEIRKALKEAYPFGMRKMHPYKIWCDEIKVQLKKRRFGAHIKPVPKEQMKLF
jgi:hypothetical protein